MNNVCLLYSSCSNRAGRDVTDVVVVKTKVRNNSIYVEIAESKAAKIKK